MAIWRHLQPLDALLLNLGRILAASWPHPRPPAASRGQNPAGALPQAQRRAGRPDVRGLRAERARNKDKLNLSFPFLLLGIRQLGHFSSLFAPNLS